MIDRFFGKYRFLSNFYPCEMSLGIGEFTFPTLEHAYQASKSRDIEYRKRILACKTPGEAKKIGKLVKIRDGWDDDKLWIMETLLRRKFEKEPFRQWLLDTGDEELIEGNTWGDTFWGVCNGKGENHLGKLLMKVRKEWVSG